MLPKAVLLFLCLFIGQTSAQYGQGYNNGNQEYGAQGVGRHNNENQRPIYSAGGQQQYGNQGVDRGSGSSGGFGYYNNNDQQGQTYNNNNGQGLGQGYNNGQVTYGAGIGQSNSNQGYHQDGYAGLGRSNQDYSSLGRSNNNDYRNNGAYMRMKREDKLQKRALGQETKPHGVGPGQGLGQGSQPAALGQNQPAPGLGQNRPGIGQHTQQDLGQNTQPGLKQGDNFGLRSKRYVERKPYSKSCNSYYEKYICYRLYENTASIPHEFTCWSTFTGKKNCTETENVLYLDRRNVEVDPDEVGRHYNPISDSRRDSQRDEDFGGRQSSSRGQYRQRDDEFGAVEKNMHNRRNKDPELPRD